MTSNRKRLQEAGLLKEGARFSAEDAKAIDSLSDDEVKSLVNIFRKHKKGIEPVAAADADNLNAVRHKLGDGFFKRGATQGKMHTIF